MRSRWVADRQTGTEICAGAELLPLILKLKSQSTLSIQTNNKHAVTTRAGSLEAIRELLVSTCVCMCCLEANVLRQW